jgi:hypothetical protein
MDAQNTQIWTARLWIAIELASAQADIAPFASTSAGCGSYVR